MRDLEYDREYQLERYHRLRAEALEMLGGQCVVCDSVEDLQIDHIDPSTKEFSVSKLRPSRERWLAELTKCQILCGDCHRLKTVSEQRDDTHGTWGPYNRGCRCDLCREKFNSYMRDYRKRVGR